MSGVIERRLLVNYRADPDAVSRLLPAPLRPQLAGDAAVVGICLIRLGSLRPHRMPAGVGVRTENAAHRIAVTWDDPAVGPRSGVYILHRHSASRATVALGGRLFPGVHRHAAFDVDERADRIGLTVHDGARELVDVEVAATAAWPGRLFAGLDAASEFFRQGCDGYSPARRPGLLEGIQLRTDAWAATAAVPTRVRSAVFDDRRLFPAGTVEPDHALVMRDVPVTWHSLTSLPAA
jgi:hypothetical protein